MVKEWGYINSTLDFLLQIVQYANAIVSLALLAVLYKIVKILLGRLRKLPKLLFIEHNYTEEHRWVGQKWIYYNGDIENIAYLRGIFGRRAINCQMRLILTPLDQEGKQIGESFPREHLAWINEGNTSSQDLSTGKPYPIRIFMFNDDEVAVCLAGGKPHAKSRLQSGKYRVELKASCNEWHGEEVLKSWEEIYLPGYLKKFNVRPYEPSYFRGRSFISRS